MIEIDIDNNDAIKSLGQTRISDNMYQIISVHMNWRKKQHNRFRTSILKGNQSTDRKMQYFSVVERKLSSSVILKYRIHELIYRLLKKQFFVLN